MRLLVPALFIAAVAVAAVAVGRSGEDDLQTRYERTVEAGEDAAVTALLKEHRFEVIFLVDGYLEGWLKQTETPEAERMKNPESLLRMGIEAAEFADAALGGDAYLRYATAWKRWSAEDRLSFREGQKRFYAGREAQKEKRYERAAELYRESLALAEPLGDLWGIAQAEQALGDLAIGAGDPAAATARHQKASEVFGSVNHPKVLRSLNALGMLHEQAGELPEARQSLEEMLRLATLVDHTTDTSKVRASLARVCRAMGDEGAAENYETDD